jgi:UDP-4-amino-4,6-dideoxy-N-acetyl-beta-L-altrosamine N-acetyltransferase
MLVDNELILRPIKETDAAFFFNWRNDISYIKHTKSFRLPKHEGMETAWVNAVNADRTNTTVILIITVDNLPIGFVQLSNIDWISRNAYFGIAICETSTKAKGYGKRTSKLVLDYAFKDLNIHKISLEVTDFNLFAIKLYESLGFKQEGMLREHYFWENEYRDVHLYGLLKKEYK